MKYLLIILLVVGCTHNDEATRWLSDHPKPIKIYCIGSNGLGEKYYTFVDSTGNVYGTGPTELELPNRIDKP
jgi:hypothetical protein